MGDEEEEQLAYAWAEVRKMKGGLEEQKRQTQSGAAGRADTKAHGRKDDDDYSEQGRPVTVATERKTHQRGKARG